MKAMKGIEDRTCIRFIDKDSSANGRNWIKFIQDDTECVYPETVGMTGKTRGQDVVLSSDCLSSGQIQRYLGRILGLSYEESRPDHFQYIRYDPNLPECIPRANEANLSLQLGELHNPAATDIVFDYVSHMFVNTKCYTPIGINAPLDSSGMGIRIKADQIGSSDS